MTKVNIKRLDSVTKNDTTATEQINDNFQALQAAIENTVSRDGAVPNYMDADLDLNSYRIINAGDPVNKHDVVTIKYFEEQAGGAIEAAAEAKANAAKATSSAQSALVASNNAIGQVAKAESLLLSAEGQLADTKQYVEQARADINQTVEDSIEYVEQEAVKAATEVVGSVVGQYTDKAETAAKNAEADASRTAESANQASASATSAAASASEAEAIAGEVSVYNFKNKITNCITEIPQDIKLELVDGTLTLKAGSKVYVPNGTHLQTTSDLSLTITKDGEYLITAHSNGSAIYYQYLVNCVSGSTDSLAGTNYHWWFDTTNSVINRYMSNASTPAQTLTMPIAIITVSNGAISSIDQVFNGFGYIGSTAFALPGVKGLIPNGRNADGSLKNTEFTVPNVVTRTITWNNAAGQELFIGKYGTNRDLEFISTSGLGHYYQQDDEPTKVLYALWYKPTENKNYRCDKNSDGTLLWRDVLPCYIGQWFTSRTSPYPITELTTKLPFRAVDQNDFNKLDEEVTTLDAQNVKLTGNQTIGNTKSFTGRLITTQNGVHQVYNADGATLSSYILDNARAYRADGVTPWFFVGAQKQNSAYYQRMGIWNDANTEFAAINVGFDSNGNKFTDAPTPPASDNSTQIATTAWVNNKHKVVTSLPSTLEENTFYYIPE